MKKIIKILKVRTADINSFFLKISSLNRASRGKKNVKNLKKIDLSHTVGDIDLSSNQILDFLENFTQEKK